MDLLTVIISLTVLVFSAIFHEVAHGYMAERLGDPTARLAGRLTLNPRSHIDPFMSIILPLLLIFSGSPVIFGGAKPVPVDPFNLREGRKDIALVSLAGPLTNVIIALLASGIIRLLLLFFSASPFVAILHALLVIVVRINLLLAIFNLLPIPPLDGSKVFSLILPERDAAAYMGLGTIGMFVLFFLLMFPIGGFSLSQLIFSLLSLTTGILLP